MNCSMRFLATVLLAFSVLGVSSESVVGQEMQDVVYLKDGSVIRGTIVEQVPGVSVLIQTPDGNRFRYEVAKIEKIAKERAPNASVPAQVAIPRPKSPGSAWALSFILPGAGQFYNRDTGNGFWFLMRHIVFSGALVEQSNCVSTDCNNGLIGLWAGAVVVNWIWSQVDAYQGAENINKAASASANVAFRVQFAPEVKLRPKGLEGIPEVRGRTDIRLVRVTW